MQKLMENYNLPVGTTIMSRSRARNCCGWSAYSVPHSSDIRINQAPKALTLPETVSATAQGFSMKWPKGAVRTILYCDNGVGTKFVPRYTTSADLTVTVPAVAGVLSHRCYLEARNECGTMRSETKTIVMPKVPSKVNAQQVSESSCSLEIRWDAPASNGEPIKNYIVEV